MVDDHCIVFDVVVVVVVVSVVVRVGCVYTEWIVVRSICSFDVVAAAVVVE